jgi:hypothetical protein
MTDPEAGTKYFEAGVGSSRHLAASPAPLGPRPLELHSASLLILRTALPPCAGIGIPTLVKPSSRKRNGLASRRPGYRWNMIDFPDRTLRREQDLWRERLEAAQSRYESDRNEESRAELRRALKVFADLVMNGRMPRDLA